MLKVLRKVVKKVLIEGKPPVDSYQQYIHKRKQIRKMLENFGGNDITLQSFRNTLSKSYIISASIYAFKSSSYSDNYTMDENILNVDVKSIHSDKFAYSDKFEFYERDINKATESSFSDLSGKEYTVSRRHLIWMKDIQKVRVKDNQMLIEYIVDSNYGGYLHVFLLEFDRILD